MTALFDAYSGFGGNKPGVRQRPSAEEWAGRMARLGIERALVRTAPEDLDSDFVSGNESLLAACEARGELVACPVVVPDTAGDVAPDDEQVAALLARGAGAVALRPKAHQWMLDEWLAGPLLEALARRRVPVFCKHDQVSAEQLADLARRRPQLPILLAETGYRAQRVVLPLMKAFANVHVCLGGAYSLHRGLEQLVEQVGPERVLFGTGFPHAEPMAAVTLLMYANVSDDQRSLIGAGNLERLVGGIVR